MTPITVVPAAAVGLAIAALVGAALAAGVAELAGARLLEVGMPSDALAAATGTALELFAHNVRVAVWPLALVALEWQRHTLTRWIADALVAAQLLAHGALIGAALAQHPGLWRYLPHLPAEWLAIALPAAAWIAARPHPRAVNRSELIRLAAGVVALLVSAAIVETYLRPGTRLPNDTGVSVLKRDPSGPASGRGGSGAGPWDRLQAWPLPGRLQPHAVGSRRPPAGRFRPPGSGPISAQAQGPAPRPVHNPPQEGPSCPPATSTASS